VAAGQTHAEEEPSIKRWQARPVGHGVAGPQLRVQVPGMPSIDAPIAQRPVKQSALVVHPSPTRPVLGTQIDVPETSVHVNPASHVPQVCVHQRRAPWAAQKAPSKQSALETQVSPRRPRGPAMQRPSRQWKRSPHSESSTHSRVQYWRAGRDGNASVKQLPLEHCDASVQGSPIWRPVPMRFASTQPPQTPSVITQTSLAGQEPVAASHGVRQRNMPSPRLPQ